MSDGRCGRLVPGKAQKGFKCVSRCRCRDFIGAFAASYILQNLIAIAPHFTSFVYSQGFEEEFVGQRSLTIHPKAEIDWKVEHWPELRELERVSSTLKP